MKRAGYILFTLLYIAGFAFMIVLNFDLFPEKDHTVGRISDVLECGFDEKYDIMYQPEYAYTVDEVVYDIPGKCAKAYDSDVDIIYSLKNPKNAYIYGTTWKMYLLSLLSFLVFIPMTYFVKGIGKEMTRKKKAIFFGTGLILFGFSLFYVLGHRFGPLECIVNAEVNSVFPFIILFSGVGVIVFQRFIFKVKDKLTIED